MREKLIELLVKKCCTVTDKECSETYGCENCFIGGGTHIGSLADFLIKNGVTIPVRCSECKYLEISGTWHDGISEECGLDIISDIDDIDVDYCHYGERKEECI